MDIKVVAIPKFSRYLLMLGLPFCFVSPHSYSAESEAFLCGGKQASTSELPHLDSNCPIGKGLWGKSAPKGKDSTFWIQCGLLDDPMPLSRAKVLYKHISTDVWMKAEGKAMRCLIGPYNDYATAKKELAGVASEALYKDAFIREVRKGEKSSPVVTQKPVSKPKETVTKKPVTPKETNAKVSSSTATPVAPPVVKTAMTTTVVDKVPKASSSDTEAPLVSIRRQTQINGLTYAIPYVMDSKIQFYMENDVAWNRLSYEGAVQHCQQQNMRLATEKEWAQLLSSKVMEKEKWPMYLPYWGSNNKGLFTTGKVNTLKGTSLLNVLCVK